MGNIIFSITIAILSLQFFTATYQLNGINRTLYNIPISIFEASIDLVSSSEKPTLGFNGTKLQSYLTYYFDNSLSKYSNSYSFSIYYYNSADESFCRFDCTDVEITLKAKVMLTYNYQKVARFHIQKN